MSLNLYGIPTAIRAVKINSRVVESPVEIYGMGTDIDFRLETNTASYRPAIPRKELPKHPAKRYYAGYCRAGSNFREDAVPMAPVLTTFLLANELIFSRHYMDAS